MKKIITVFLLTVSSYTFSAQELQISDEKTHMTTEYTGQLCQEAAALNTNANVTVSPKVQKLERHAYICELNLKILVAFLST